MRNSKNNFKNIVLLILLNTIFLDAAFYAQSPFDWPVDVDPSTGKGQVNGNIGEYRGESSARIHKGLDLVGVNASNRVLALEDGAPLVGAPARMMRALYILKTKSSKLEPCMCGQTYLFAPRSSAKKTPPNLRSLMP